ncbi:MAG: hypothetical protein ACO29Y_05965 [Holophagaceae bacterium]
MYNPAAYDPSGFSTPDLGDPRRQEKLPGGYATQGQSVSAPYAEANMKAAEKTNPMNAASQGAGKPFLDSYLQKGGFESGLTAEYSNRDRQEDTMLIKMIESGQLGPITPDLRRQQNEMIDRLSGIRVRGV